MSTSSNIMSELLSHRYDSHIIKRRPCFPSHVPKLPCHVRERPCVTNDVLSKAIRPSIARPRSRRFVRSGTLFRQPIRRHCFYSKTQRIFHHHEYWRLQRYVVQCSADRVLVEQTWSRRDRRNFAAHYITRQFRYRYTSSEFFPLQWRTLA
jgi:hypothetical protein